MAKNGYIASVGYNIGGVGAVAEGSWRTQTPVREQRVSHSMTRGGNRNKTVGQRLLQYSFIGKGRIA